MAANIWVFLFFYVILYMGSAVSGTFMPVYFQSVGFTQAQIGGLLSFGPLVAVLAQPVWGSLGDKSRTKNLILTILLTGSGVSMLLYPLHDSFAYLLLIMCLFTFFQTPAFAITDAITLEALGRQAGSYGIIRMGGTFGYAVMSLLFGFYAKEHIGSMFGTFALVMLAGLLLLLRFPKVKGHQYAGRKMQIWQLFANRRLVLYLGFCFAINLTLGYYYAFFPLFFKGLGADNGLLGWSAAISAVSEVPFLLLSGKIFSRVRIPYILLGAAAATALRWLLFSVLHSPYAILPVQALHGLIFIVISVTMSVFINKEVPGELKASGQTLNGLINLGIARMIGSFAGGIASEHFGMQKLFLYSSVITVASMLLFALVAFRRELRIDTGISS
ncbi:MFS transporter [Paenibacillus humicola]|uniref:MFS transporter n=1 Tax=Paenibacillus humicola TaxID=3110540 RepID=UPI00237BDE3B|nr:MFS transporter [Paenibacillus humicola]